MTDRNFRKVQCKNLLEIDKKLQCRGLFPTFSASEKTLIAKISFAKVGDIFATLGPFLASIYFCRVQSNKKHRFQICLRQISFRAFFSLSDIGLESFTFFMSKQKANNIFMDIFSCRTYLNKCLFPEKDYGVFSRFTKEVVLLIYLLKGLFSQFRKSQPLSNREL